MKVLRNTLLPSFLVLMLSFVFSSVTASTASAQQDEVSQAQEQGQTSPPPPPNQGQAYDKPDAERPMEIPDESANATANAPGNNSDQGDSDQNDPPGRAARLQYVTGSVSIQPHGTADWVQGSVNRPLTIADNVWADKNSRAELNVGTGLIRIGSESSLTLTNVSDNSVQLSLHQGAMNLHVRHLYRGEIYEVDTPNQAFTILKTGDYRFDVDPNADTTLVTVWRGEGESTGQGPSVRVKEHQQARFSSGNSLAHEIHNAPSRDGFDDWCQVRDRREDNSVSARYVSPDVIGSEDLDDYGTWRDTPQYGHVWVPSRVDSGWAPYSAGHWIYQDPWGWTWVDDAPWGFAPFHYGRWVSFGGYWGWSPGPYYGGWGRGWYAPALVSWYGGGGWGVGFGFGFGGGFGWCPLGWGEPFLPWYHAGWGYFRNVNFYNTRFNNINGFHNGFRNGFANGGGFSHANLNVRGGFNAVSRGTLERGLPVNQNAVRVNPSAIRNAPALNRVNASPTNAGRSAAGAPARAISRPVVSRMTPPAASRPSSFGSSRAGNASRMTGEQSNANVSSSSNTRGQVSSSSGVGGGHYVPRPPQSFARSNNAVTANNNNSANNARGPNNSMAAARTVPRPPSGGGTSMRAQPASSSSTGSRSVPRPTGQALPAPRNYSSSGNSSNYSGRSYGRSNYGSSQYSSSPYGGRSYGRSSYEGSRSAPSQGGRSYGGGSYGRSYSAPSHSSSSAGSSRSSGGSGGSRGSSHSGGHR
jgi:hypothetical protein